MGKGKNGEGERDLWTTNSENEALLSDSPTGQDLDRRLFFDVIVRLAPPSRPFSFTDFDIIQKTIVTH